MVIINKSKSVNYMAETHQNTTKSFSAFHKYQISTYMGISVVVLELKT